MTAAPLLPAELEPGHPPTRVPPPPGTTRDQAIAAFLAAGAAAAAALPVGRTAA